MNMNTAVSAIIPTYNGEKYLMAAVESVIVQTLPPLELIIVDDGSKELQENILNGIHAPFPIIFIRQTNAGQSAARNAGVKAANGQLIAFLDQDDNWYPRHLEGLIKPFLEDQNKNIGLVYSNLDRIEEDGTIAQHRLLDHAGGPHPKKQLVDFLRYDLMILPSASLIRKSAFESINGFDPRFRGYEDDDLFLRLFMQGWQHLYISEPLSQWRINPFSCSFTEQMDISRDIYMQKLLSAFPDEPDKNYYPSRDLIRPRFSAARLAAKTNTAYMKLVKSHKYMFLRPLRGILPTKFKKILFTFFVRIATLFQRR